MIRFVLRAGALFDLALGLVLLAAPWRGLYDALGLPDADPELFTQVGGSLLLAFAYLLWIAHRDVRLTQAAALASALAHALAAVVIAAWLTVGGVDSVLLWLVVPLLGAFAAAEAWIAARSIAMLLPPD